MTGWGGTLSIGLIRHGLCAQVLRLCFVLFCFGLWLTIWIDLDWLVGGRAGAERRRPWEFVFSLFRITFSLIDESSKVGAVDDVFVGRLSGWWEGGLDGVGWFRLRLGQARKHFRTLLPGVPPAWR